MKIPKYREILKKGKERLDDALVPNRVRRARHKAEIKKLELQERLVDYEIKLAEAALDKDVNFDRIIDILDDLSITERRIKQYDDLLGQMFTLEDTAKSQE